jgi:hypothetical protein
MQPIGYAHVRARRHVITFSLSTEPKTVISAPDPVAVLETHAERYASVRTKVICDDKTHASPVDHERLVEQRGSDGVLPQPEPQ